MNPDYMEIGLPQLTGEDIEFLAENCENAVTNYILSKIPQKSIEEIAVSCSLEIEEQLEVEIIVEINQKYATGHNLDDVVSDSISFGIDWIESKLQEMKND